jgi:hypothetical protein
LEFLTDKLRHRAPCFPLLAAAGDRPPHGSQAPVIRSRGSSTPLCSSLTSLWAPRISSPVKDSAAAGYLHLLSSRRSTVSPPMGLHQLVHVILWTPPPREDLLARRAPMSPCRLHRATCLANRWARQPRLA